MVRSASADEPVAGADVELRSTLSWSARTDGKGEAVLAGVGSGWRTLVVRATGYAPSSRMITSAQATPESRIVVQLERGAAVGGRVISPAGEPIAGARVWATSVSEPFPTIDPRLDAAVSDAKGRWQMPALPAGSFRFTAAHDAHSETTTAPHAFDGSTAKDDVVIKLEPGGTITGTVVDGGGKPVAGASVRATGVGRVFWGLARETIADEQGTFALSGLPRRSFELVARHADRASELVPADLTASGQAKVTLALAIDGAIAGTVVDSGGDPVADAQLFVEPRWSGSRDERSVWRSRGVPMASADREGSFRIGGLPRGTYRIHAARAGADIGLLQLSSGVEASPGDSAVRIVVPAHAVITGKVAFADGSAPGAFSVGVGPSLEMPFSTKHGRFSISAVAGKHNIIVSGPSILTRTVPDVEIAESDETDIGTITVERGRSVSGRVVDRDGVPVAGAKVAAGRLLTGGGNEFNIPSEGFDVQETQTDASGRFLLAGFDERSLVVVAQHDQRGRSSSIRVPASSVSANVELVLSPTGAVHGRVRKSGQPLAETVVIANTIGASQQNYFVVTGPDGSFAFDKLAAGEYTLSAMLGQGGGRPKDMHFRSVDVVAGQRKEVNVDIAEGPITLSVLVQSDDGKPVAIAQIFFGTGSFEAELTNFDQMRERNRFGDGIGAAYLRNQMMGAPAEIAGLVPGEYTACAMPIPADPRDQNAMQRMFSQADRLPVRCKALGRIETSPDRPFVITVPVDWTRPAS
jgi:protocatechuate 3,4-dioxygenase beta subunit